MTTYTTKTIIDQIVINEDNSVIYRQNVQTLDENNNVISQAYSRFSLYPGQELINEPSNVIAICNVIWTPDVVSAYQASLVPPTPTTTGA